MTLRIYFSDEQNKVKVSYALKMLVRRAIVETLASEGVEEDCEVSVTFTDRAGIRELNRRFREIDAETDVLSFPLFEDCDADGRSVRMLGDIVLSLEQCRAQAEEYGHSFERECAFLTVHSTLHLLGYDHVTSEEDERDMRARQRVVMQRLGLAIPEAEA